MRGERKPPQGTKRPQNPTDESKPTRRFSKDLKKNDFEITEYKRSSPKEASMTSYEQSPEKNW